MKRSSQLNKEYVKDSFANLKWYYFRNILDKRNFCQKEKEHYLKVTKIWLQLYSAPLFVTKNKDLNQIFGKQIKMGTNEKEQDSIDQKGEGETPKEEKEQKKEVETPKESKKEIDLENYQNEQKYVFDDFSSLSVDEKKLLPKEFQLEETPKKTYARLKVGKENFVETRWINDIDLVFK